MKEMVSLICQRFAGKWDRENSELAKMVFDFETGRVSFFDWHGYDISAKDGEVAVDVGVKSHRAAYDFAECLLGRIGYRCTELKNLANGVEWTVTEKPVRLFEGALIIG